MDVTSDFDPSTRIIKTDKGYELQEFKWTLNTFLKRSTALVGGSGSGKSTIIKAILKILKPHIEQVLVVCPTELQSPSYSEFIDPILIHYKMEKKIANPKKASENNKENSAIRFLDLIWKRQEIIVSIYKKANENHALDGLRKRLPSRAREELNKYAELAERRKKSCISNIEHQYAFDAKMREKKIKEVNETFKNLIYKMCKKYFKDNYKMLSKQNLTADEKYALNYLDLNPHLLLILDDCAADYKTLFKKDDVMKFFYQGRHAWITLIIACQSDKDLPADIRKNIFVNFYTDINNCISSFETKSNSYPKELINTAKDISNKVFKDASDHKKLVYLRNTEPGQKQFYWTKAPIHPPFKFGSSALHELCNMIRCTEKKIDESNPFYKNFSLD
jgi:energy-coupling factor transporter ATP-binding protein EcfA2